MWLKRLWVKMHLCLVALALGVYRQGDMADIIDNDGRVVIDRLLARQRALLAKLEEYNGSRAS